MLIMVESIHLLDLLNKKLKEIQEYKNLQDCFQII